MMNWRKIFFWVGMANIGSGSLQLLLSCNHYFNHNYKSMMFNLILAIINFAVAYMQGRNIKKIDRDEKDKMWRILKY